MHRTFDAIATIIFLAMDFPLKKLSKMFHFSYIVDNPNMAIEIISILLITLNNTQRTGKINLRVGNH